MNKLVRNELYKIFHKKAIYILTAVMCGLSLLVVILDKNINTNNLNSLLVPTLEQAVDSYDLTKPDQAAAYVEVKAEIDKYKLIDELNLTYYSPEEYYLDNTVSDVIIEYYTEKYINKDEEKTKIAEEKMNKEIETLKHFDWKANVQTTLDAIKASEELDEEDKNLAVQVLQYRLDNNIPISYSTASQELDSFVGLSTKYKNMSKDDKTYVNHDELYEKKQIESEYAILKYKIDKGLIKDYGANDKAQDMFISVFSGVSIFLIVCILMITGTQVSEEFSKGTIKQLLTRPFSRGKILASKMIASFITILAFMVFNAIFNAVVASVAYGTFNTLFDPVLYYNFNTQTVIELNTLTASLLSLAGILPEIIILLLFAVLVSILTGNTAVSIILGFVLAFSETLFGGLVSKVKLLTFFPIFNWNLTTYFFGGMNYIKNMSFGKSLIVDIVTIIGLFIACVIVFKKKDIKNQ